MINNRYDFVFLFDVKDGNPNGDPDAANLPRIDPETGHGLVSDVCVKRKLRNFVLLSKTATDGWDIFVKEKAILNNLIDEAYERIGIAPSKGPKAEGDDNGGKKGKTKAKGSGAEVDKARAEMCRRYFDVRAFGAVMSTGANAGQVRGPVQITFSRSIDPIATLEHSITRMAVATQEESDKQSGDNRTMGRKHTVSYGLYRGHGFISAPFAKQTGFSEDDLSLLWDAFQKMFDHDHSAARGLMALRQLVVFKHDNELGSAPAHKLFELVSVQKKEATKVARDFSDYEVTVGKPPAGVHIVPMPV